MAAPFAVVMVLMCVVAGPRPAQRPAGPPRAAVDQGHRAGRRVRGTDLRRRVLRAGQAEPDHASGECRDTGRARPTLHTRDRGGRDGGTRDRCRRSRSPQRHGASGRRPGAAHHGSRAVGGRTPRRRRTSRGSRPGDPGVPRTAASGVVDRCASSSVPTIMRSTRPPASACSPSWSRWARRRGIPVEPALVAAALDHRHGVDGRPGPVDARPRRGRAGRLVPAHRRAARRRPRRRPRRVARPGRLPRRARLARPRLGHPGAAARTDRRQHAGPARRPGRRAQPRPRHVLGRPAAPARRPGRRSGRGRPVPRAGPPGRGRRRPRRAGGGDPSRRRRARARGRARRAGAASRAAAGRRGAAGGGGVGRGRGAAAGRRPVGAHGPSADRGPSAPARRRPRAGRHPRRRRLLPRPRPHGRRPARDEPARGVGAPGTAAAGGEGPAGAGEERRRAAGQADRAVAARVRRVWARSASTSVAATSSGRRRCSGCRWARRCRSCCSTSTPRAATRSRWSCSTGGSARR